eukprot:COSAG05_NODE_198_length_14502_cov_41.134416_5_plen_82_part_00
MRLTSCNDASPSMRVHIDAHIDCISSPYSGTVVGDTPFVKVEWVWLIDGAVWISWCTGVAALGRRQTGVAVSRPLVADRSC